MLQVGRQVSAADMEGDGRVVEALELAQRRIDNLLHRRLKSPQLRSSNPTIQHLGRPHWKEHETPPGRYESVLLRNSQISKNVHF